MAVYESLGGAAAILTLGGLVYRGLRTKIDEKASAEGCRERHKAIDKELRKGDLKFTAIMKTQARMTETLARIEERVNRLTEVQDG